MNAHKNRARESSHYLDTQTLGFVLSLLLISCFCILSSRSYAESNQDRPTGTEDAAKKEESERDRQRRRQEELNGAAGLHEAQAKNKDAEYAAYRADGNEAGAQLAQQQADALRQKAAVERAKAQMHGTQADLLDKDSKYHEKSAKELRKEGSTAGGGKQLTGLATSPSNNSALPLKRSDKSDYSSTGSSFASDYGTSRSVFGKEDSIIIGFDDDVKASSGRGKSIRSLRSTHKPEDQIVVLDKADFSQGQTGSSRSSQQTGLLGQSMNHAGTDSNSVNAYSNTGRDNSSRNNVLGGQDLSRSSIRGNLKSILNNPSGEITSSTQQASAKSPQEMSGAMRLLASLKNENTNPKTFLKPNQNTRNLLLSSISSRGISHNNKYLSDVLKDNLPIVGGSTPAYHVRIR